MVTNRYSIIVPHYNDLCRLQRLLLSIPTDRSDLEVIVVDDCSPNLDRMKTFVLGWPRVRFFSTSVNSGAGVARNVGLDEAGGAWLIFADSDDEFLEGAFDTFDRVLREEDQVVYFLAEAVQEMNGGPSVRAERLNQLVIDYATCPSSNAYENLLLRHVNPMAKVYSAQLVKKTGVRFDTVRLGNDIAFNVLVALQARIVRTSLDRVYRIYRRTGSLTSTATSVDVIARLEVLGDLNDRLRGLNLHYRMDAAAYLVCAMRLGPAVLVEVLKLIWRYEMVGSTLRRLRPREIIRSFLRDRRSCKEISRLGGVSRKQKI